MAGILENLAMGLRSAGAIMDEGVHRGQRQEELIQQQLQEKRKDLMAQQVIKAAETGAMPPDVARQALERIGYQGVAVGPDAATQERVQRARLEEGYRLALERLGPEATIEAQAQLAARFGKPEVAAQMHNALETRKLREFQIVSEIERGREKLAQDLQIAQQRGADQRELAQMRIDAEERMRKMMLEGRADLVRLAASLRPAPQGPVPQIVQTENGPMQVDRSGRAVPIVGPDGQPVRPKSTEKALPTSAAQKLMENQQNLRRAEQAFALVSPPQGQEAPAGNDPNATGWKGFLPNTVLNIADPKGVEARAAIADLGSLVIHDRSGAAVTAAEFPRLAPFIPRATDDPATVRKKLDRFVKEYRNVVQEAADFYQQSGYRVPTEALRVGAGGASGGWSVREKP